MAILDFGRVFDAIKAGMSANAARDTSPIPAGQTTITTANFNTSSFSDATARAQLLFGNSNEMVWGVHEWDDIEHKVIQ